MPALQAVTIHVVEDSPQRFAFDLVWGADLPEPGADFAEATDGNFRVTATDLQTSNWVVCDSRFGVEGFDIVFDWLDARSLAAARLDFFNGSQYLPLAGEDYGGRFVFGAPFEVSGEGGGATSVPDGGHPAWMLGAGCAALALCRRWMGSTRGDRR